MFVNISDDSFPSVDIPKKTLRRMSRAWSYFKPHSQETNFDTMIWNDLLSNGVAMIEDLTWAYSDDLSEVEELNLSTSNFHQDYEIEQAGIGISYGIVHHTDSCHDKGFSVIYPLTKRQYVLKAEDDETLTEQYKPIYLKSHKLHSLQPYGRQLQPFLFLLIDYKPVD